MSASKSRAPSPVAITLAADLRVECYVRSSVPAPIADTIDSVVERLHRLHDQGHIAEYTVSCWPPETVDTNAPTRTELVAEFEHWGDEHDHSIRPAFRRQQVSVSPFGDDSDAPCERVRVPVVALALYDADGSTTTSASPLRGVVPYTDRSDADNPRTYTVDDWLSAVEAAEENTDGGSAQDELHPLSEGRQ